MAKKSTKEMKGCECNKSVNEELAASGISLAGSFSINFKSGSSSYISPLIEVKWKDKPRRGKRLPIITCAYCPFCGKKKPTV